MKIFDVLIVSVFLALPLSAFSQKKFLIGGGMDVYRTDNTNPFTKAQAGMELNFFLHKSITLSGGMEVWSDPNLTFLSFGTRIYIAKPLFIRFRGLVREEVELTIGSGYGIPIGKRLWIEFASDYYLEQKELGLRAGAAIGF